MKVFCISVKQRGNLSLIKCYKLWEKTTPLFKYCDLIRRVRHAMGRGGGEKKVGARVQYGIVKSLKYSSCAKSQTHANAKSFAFPSHFINVHMHDHGFL